MRSFLFLNIASLLILTACAPVKKSQFTACPKGSFQAPAWSSPFRQDFEKALFHASMDVKDKHLSGIAIIKRTSDTSFHFTFANEIGITYFDLEILKDNYQSIYVFEPMNKSALLKILFRDFNLLLFSDSKCGNPDKYLQKGSGKEVFSYPGLNLYVWMAKENGLVSKLVGWTNPYDAAIIEFNDYSKAFPSDIQLSNPTIKLSLCLNLLGR